MNKSWPLPRVFYLRRRYTATGKVVRLRHILQQLALPSMASLAPSEESNRRPGQDEWRGILKIPSATQPQTHLGNFLGSYPICVSVTHRRSKISVLGTNFNNSCEKTGQKLICIYVENNSINRTSLQFWMCLKIFKSWGQGSFFVC